LANKLTINPSTVSRWLDGSTRPDSPETIVRVADLLRVHGTSERRDLLMAAGYAGVVTQPSDVRDTHVEADRKRSKNILQRRITKLIEKGIATAPEWVIRPVLQHENLYSGVAWQSGALQIETSCGRHGIDLKHQRLAISAAFGPYMTGLLERKEIYTPLDGQIDTPHIRGLESLGALSRIIWALVHPLGPRAVVIGAESGMGKSTLAAWLVRCMWRQGAFDLLLGDSAKWQQVDMTTGAITTLQPGYYDPASCLAKLREQLGLPMPTQSHTSLEDIRDRLAGRRAILIVDNLESVSEGDLLLHILKRLLSRDTRAIVTTRRIKELSALSLNSLVIHLQPLTTIPTLRAFLTWHIAQFQSVQPYLYEGILDDIPERHFEELLTRTGGVPLLVQLVFTQAARQSWAYLEDLPKLFSVELLEFLYRERWQELAMAGQAGQLGRALLQLMAEEQTSGQSVDSNRLRAWVKERGEMHLLSDALQLLYERFLIVNHDLIRGNFTVFPSLAEFLRRVSMGL
jgi:hypothetical protein